MLLYPLCCSPDVPVATTKGLHTASLTPEILMAGKLSFCWMVIFQGKLRSGVYPCKSHTKLTRPRDSENSMGTTAFGVWNVDFGPQFEYT